MKDLRCVLFYAAAIIFLQVACIPPWYKIPLPKQLLPHELKNVSLDKPLVYHPQPFSYPGYPVILYL